MPSVRLHLLHQVDSDSQNLCVRDAGVTTHLRMAGGASSVWTFCSAETSGYKLVDCMCSSDGPNLTVARLQGAPQEGEDQADGPSHAADPDAQPAPSVSARFRDAAANVADQVIHVTHAKSPTTVFHSDLGGMNCFEPTKSCRDGNVVGHKHENVLAEGQTPWKTVWL